MVANDLTKVLSIIKYKYFVWMTRIKNKREFLAFIKQRDDLKDAF